MKALKIFLMFALVAGMSQASYAQIATEGLVLHLDAASQVKAAGAAATNAAWHNLAVGKPGAFADAILHNFKDGVSGWIGGGKPNDPFALRFDGREAYVEGQGNLEMPELTLETWARIEGVGNHEQKGINARGAALIGNDFGEGGVALMMQPVAKTPMVLHGTTFTTLPGEVSTWEWQHFVLTLKNGKARVYANSELTGIVDAPRELQANHIPSYLLGCARKPTSDFVEADGLVGAISVVRVYNRALNSNEVAQNFNSEKGKFPVSATSQSGQVSSMPVPKVPGLGQTPPVRAMRWDYYKEPPRISGTGIEGQPATVRYAFDGYPTRLDQPYVSTHWRAPVTPEKPAEATINYLRPVAVTRFVHHFIKPYAWKSVEVQQSADGESWQTLQKFDDLAPEQPQVLPIDNPKPAKFYRLVVTALQGSAQQTASHEIETWYGATVGMVSLDGKSIEQGLPTPLTVRVVNPDAPITGARVKIVGATNALAEATNGMMEADLPKVEQAGASEVTMNVTSQQAGAVPLSVELWIDDQKIDARPATLHVIPALAFSNLKEPPVASEGQLVSAYGTLTNTTKRLLTGIQVSWMNQSAPLPDLEPGKSVNFELRSKAKPGLVRAELKAIAEGVPESVALVPVLGIKAEPWTTQAGAVNATWTPSDGAVRLQTQSPAVGGMLRLFVQDKMVPLTPVGVVDGAPQCAAPVPGGTLVVRFGAKKLSMNADKKTMTLEDKASGPTDLVIECEVLPTDPSLIPAPLSDFEFRLAVDKPKVMFRPHIDWYTVEHGPNWVPPQNGHNSATRMLSIETSDGATLSMVPDTDNMIWGFTKDNQMTLAMHMPLAPADGLGRTIFSPISDAPTRFVVSLPIIKGNWWDAYRDTVTRIFKFEQPRQYSMPITQMQMLASRYVMRYEVWSEKFQAVRSHPNMEFFYNFYGKTYDIPCLYAWYLVTDDQTARIKAEKCVKFMLDTQEKGGWSDGAWFSQYGVEGDKLVGRDQAANRWILPHTTGSSAKTLLWYWEASGKQDAQALASAKRGCEWLLKTQRPDGAWTYAYDLEGKAVSELSGAGQIWCTWALWKLGEITGDTRYTNAALRSKDAFKKTFMDVHRYMGYWEDVSGALGNLARSWEGYEPAIAMLVFTDMGDPALATEAAKDTATWSWTRVTSVRQYELAYGQTTEQSICGPSQAQSPMVGIGMQQVYQNTGDTLWSDFSGAVKAVNFCADPDQAYAMVATSGWVDASSGVAGPPYENTRPFVTPANSKGDEYGRGSWNNWCTDQFAWLALEWLVRESQVRAPEYLAINPNTYRGTVLGAPGRVKMPEEKVDVQGIDHIDINWAGFQNDQKYMLVVMNHKEPTKVMVRAHEAQLDVWTRPPQILVKNGAEYKPVEVKKEGVQYVLDLPANGTALLIWDRLE